MVSKRLILLLAPIFLTACLNTKLQSGNDNSKKEDTRVIQYDNKNIGYSFKVPTGFAFQNLKDKDIFFGYGENSPYGQLYVETFDRMSAKECNGDTLGISKSSTTLLNGNSLNWGKVDFFDTNKNNYEREAEPFCKPLNTITGAAYAACSQYNNKKSFICISQIIDNPKFAEDIFKSFRWKN